MRTAVQTMAALAALVLAMTASATALAAEDFPTVEVSGFVDGEGQPVEVESAKLEEFETPDSEPIVTPIDVAADGTFTVFLREWGTPEQPARAEITVSEKEEVVIDDDGCTIASNRFGSLTLTVPGQVQTEPIVVVLDGFVSSAVCPNPVPPDEAPQEPSVTLPPTDAQGSGAVFAGSMSTAFLLAGAALVGAAFVARRGSRSS